MNQKVDVLKKITDSNELFIIAGPCAIENKETTFMIAEKLKIICEKHKIHLIFKGSYRKANRTKFNSFTSIGDEKALKILQKIRQEFNIPVTTDIHSSYEAKNAAKFVDMIQIPAFLCRQTDILVAAAKTKKYINIKKGQFMSPENMKFAVEKIIKNGNENIFLTERGTTFGYHDLVVDFRSIPIMKKFIGNVIIDATHSIQKPNHKSGITDGDSLMIETIAKAGIAAGADGLFVETHPDPKKSQSDGSNMININRLEKLLSKLVKIKNAL